MHRTLLALLAVCLLLPCARAESEILLDDCPSTPPPRWQFTGEYLMWWLSEGHIPAVLTTSPTAAQGIIGRPDTTVLYGDQDLPTRHGDRFFGGRITAEGWFADNSFGLEGNAIFLERDSTYYKAVSDGSVLLARPYINALSGSPQSEIIAGPTADGLRTGGFVGYSRTELFSQEANVVLPLLTGTWHLDLLAGTRFLELRDRTDLTAAGNVLGGVPTVFGLEDHFRTHDFFFGGQVGLRAEYDLGCWFVDVRGEAALGGDNQQVRAFGQTITQTAAGRTVQPYGLLVTPSNTGTFSRTVLDAVCEVGVNVGYQFGSHVRVFTGYTFIGWNNPLRSGDQLDEVVNPTQLHGPLVGPARPTIPFNETFFWAQGVNIGLEVCW